MNLWAFIRVGLLTGLLLETASGAELPPLRGLGRDQLLEYRTPDGQVKKASTVTEWEARKKEALDAFLSVTGPLPEGERCPLDLRVEEETDCGSYVRRLITYASTPGGRVPAYLCVPKAALAGAAAPAVLCLHPTENSIGFKVVVGLGGKPHRQYASELAERGYVTLAPSYPLLAEYQPDLQALGFRSGTMKAVWDNIRGLDLLESLPFVKNEVGFGVIGHSLGGHNSLFTAALDPRLKVVVTSCGFDSFLDYKEGNLKGWTQLRYMPQMADYLGRPQAVPFDFYEIIACLAPRSVFVNAPMHDSNFKWESVDRIAAAARPVYDLHGGAGDRLIIRHPDSEHDFPDQERYEAYAFIQQVLGVP